MNASMEQCFEEVKRIACEIGEWLREEPIQRIHMKSDITNMVTDMDIKIQKELIKRLMPLIPNACFFAEEKDNEALGSGYTWVIDPIDGTTNYIYDYHHSAISIALVQDHHALFAVCVNPYLSECFYAYRGKGAYCNDTPIHVSDRDLSSSLIMCGSAPYDKQALAERSFAYIKELFLRGRDIRRSGSAVLDLCYLACARVDAFYEIRLSFWDYAAASLIVEEAGGCFACLEGTWGSLQRVAVLAGNPKNIDALRSVVTA